MDTTGHTGASKQTLKSRVTEYKDGRVVQSIDLKEIHDDTESIFNDTAEDTYEFQITVPIHLEGVDQEKQPVGKKEGVIKGIMRYHPYKFNQETFPQVEDTGEMLFK